MASPKFPILLLALLGAVLFLQVSLADEIVDISNGDGITTSSAIDTSSATDMDIDQDLEGDFADQSEATDLDDDLESNSGDDFVEDPEAATDIPDDSESLGSETSDLVEDDTWTESESVQELSHPLARILHERSSKKCFRTRNCKRFFRKPGCCRKRCVNVLTDNKNCGKCGHVCNTRRGYVCKSGRCRKNVHWPSSHRCSRTKKCSYGKTCCSGKCVSTKSDGENCGRCEKRCGRGKLCCNGRCKDVRSDCKNCGMCGNKCSQGSLCCSGKCSNLKSDGRNCGRCGRRCAYGQACCYGMCINISRDKENCGVCGIKCVNSNCRFGMCGY